MKKLWRKAKITVPSSREATPVRIVSDAAIATHAIGEGRLIPLLIIETSNRLDIEDLIKAHRYFSPGDCVSQWGQPEGSKNKLGLILTFKRPVELVIILDFDIVRQGGLVDQIMRANALYIQSGREGDRLKSTLDYPRILVEISHPEMQNQWDRLFFKHITQDFRKKGLSRKEAKEAAREFIESWREFGQLRKTK